MRGDGSSSRIRGFGSRGPACQENVHICQRLRAYATYRAKAIAENHDDRIYWMAARELWAHPTPVTNAREAMEVNRIGKTIAGKIESYLLWNAAMQAGTIQVRGRWEAYGEKQRWWRLECINLLERVHVRRAWGVIGADGYEETINTLASMHAAETLIANGVRERQREGYVHVDLDIGDTGMAIGKLDSSQSSPFAQDAAVLAQGSDTVATERREEVAPGCPMLREKGAKPNFIELERARREEGQKDEQESVRKGATVIGREYNPKLLNSAGCVSGVAAILIALLRAERTHGFRGFTKQEVVENAQPLCPETLMLPTNQRATSFANGRAHYGAISSLTGTLLKNGMVEYAGTKKHFRLTHTPGAGLVSGRIVAQRLERELKEHQGFFDNFDEESAGDAFPSQQHARIQHPLSSWTPERKHDDVIVVDDTEDELSSGFPDDDTSAIKRGPNGQGAAKRHRLMGTVLQRTEESSKFSLFNDDFDITLAVDSREKRQTASNEVDAMLGMLRDQHNLLRVTKKPLEVADYMWIATPRGQSLEDWRRGCLVLGRAIERKTVSDFNTTVRGGTHHSKQRLRMLRSPLTRLIYLVEGSIEDLPSPTDRQRLLDEMSRLELCDGFTVHCSDHFNTTAAYLKALDDVVRRKVCGRSTAEVLAMPDVASYDSILKSIDVDPNTWNLKKRWAVMLLHVPGLKHYHAQSIIDAGYDTPTKLVDALIAHAAKTHNKLEPLLTRILEPGKRRVKLAGDVAHFFLDQDYEAGNV